MQILLAIAMGLDLIAKRCNDAVLGHASWDDAMSAITAFVGGEKAMLLGMSSAHSYATSLIYNHDPDEISIYNDGYNQLDPRRQKSMLTPVGQVRTGQEYVPNDAIRKTAYFSDISLRGDVKDSVHGVISDNEFGRFTISVQRGFREDYFGSGEKKKLAAILRLLANCFATSRAIATVGGVCNDTCKTWLLIGTDLRYRTLIQDNRLVGESLPGNIELGKSKLVFPDKALEEAFRAGVALASEIGEASFRKDGHVFRLTPMPPQLAWSRIDHITTMLSVSPITHDSGSVIYAKAFGFTDRETEVLLAMIASGSARNAASQLDLGYETVRWHVKNMQSKCRMNSTPSMIRSAISGDLSRLN